jgi:iron complex transport system permease protein
MKVTLDLTDLVAKGRLSQAEADRLAGLADRDAGSLGANIILAFGTVAVVAAASVLLPQPITALVLGAVLMAGGFALTATTGEVWGVLARTGIVIGALMVSGAVTFYLGTSAYSVGAVSIGMAAVAVIARSGLLAALSVLGLGTAVSTGFGDVQDLWGAFVPRPTLNIVVFTLLALGLLVVSTRLASAYERLAIIAARTSILVANAGFLFASIFGDGDITNATFALVWAVLLLGAAAWGVRADRRWVVNAAAVFGGIHFLVQWFLYLGTNAGTLLLGGLFLIAFGFALYALNRRWQARRPPPPEASQSAA